MTFLFSLYSRLNHQEERLFVNREEIRVLPTGMGILGIFSHLQNFLCTANAGLCMITYHLHVIACNLYLSRVGVKLYTPCHRTSCCFFFSKSVPIPVPRCLFLIEPNSNNETNNTFKHPRALITNNEVNNIEISFLDSTVKN